jgi:hypothetical protein
MAGQFLALAFFSFLLHRPIARYIKAQRLRCFGHIQRIEDDRMVKKLTNWKQFGKRPAGKPKNRWIDVILRDTQVLKVKNWELIGNKKEWNNLVEKAKTHPGLWCCRRRR